MSVAYPKNKGCHTVASTGINKSLHRCLKLIKMHLNISCVLTAKSSMNLLQRTPQKMPFWESLSGSKSVVPGFIEVSSLRCQLSPLLSLHCRWRYSDSAWEGNNSQRTTVIQSKGSLPLYASLANNNPDPIMIPPLLVNICFACDHLKYAWVHKSTRIAD